MMTNQLLTTGLLFLMAGIHPVISQAQTQKETSAWFAAFHTQRFSDKTGLHFDAQLRSHDNIDGLKNVLIRPGITYYISGNKNATAGYLYTTTNLPANAEKNILTEHRIWEQFIYSHKIKNVSFAHRFRFEQRFMERTVGDIFTQRFRYFVRSIVPLTEQTDSSFNKGIYTALQNEVFLHVQNKDKLNGYTFDQNRAYVAGGYRFSPAFDLEIGYLNQTIKGTGRNTVNNVIQLATYTRF